MHFKSTRQILPSCQLIFKQVVHSLLVVYSLRYNIQQKDVGNAQAPGEGLRSNAEGWIALSAMTASFCPRRLLLSGGEGARRAGG
jgi:hypothetical protein